MRLLAVCLVAGCSFDGVSPGGGGGDSDASVSDGQVVADSMTSADATPMPNAFKRTVRIVPPNTVTGDVLDVPVPIELTGDPHFMANARADGLDVVVVTADGAQLDIDFEVLQPQGGHLLAWVVVPTVAMAGTEIELYYGTGHTAPQVGNPWDPLADTVWHFHFVGDAALSEPTMADSSASGYDGTLAPGQMVTTAPGIFGDGYDFDGVQILLDNNQLLNRGAATSFTTSFWFNEQAELSPFDLGFYKGGPIDPSPGYSFSMGMGNWSTGVRDGNGDEAFLQLAANGLSGWHQLALVVDRNADQARAYVDGELVDSDDIQSVGSVTNSITARFGGGNNPPDGLFDEFRTYPSARTADQMRLDYAIGDVPGTVVIDPAVAADYPTFP